MKNIVAEKINILGAFCGKRDVETLTAEELQSKFGVSQVDVMVLFGGSILCGGDVLANAIKAGIARKYIIVGGCGHTTETLRQLVHKEFPTITTTDLPEAEVFSRYIKTRYGLEVDYLETESTNCGNNITNLLALLKEHSINFKSIILCQDATMQHRMEAGLKKYVEDDVLIINFATYKATVIGSDTELKYGSDIYGMWEMPRYITLLMGEIPRLTDDSEGYGPNGKNYIAHVEIPINVREAFIYLKEIYKDSVRAANPLFASK